MPVIHYPSFSSYEHCKHQSENGETLVHLLHRRYHKVHQMSLKSVQVPTDKELICCSCFLNRGLHGTRTSVKPKPTVHNCYTVPQLLSGLTHLPLGLDCLPVLTGINCSMNPWNLEPKCNEKMLALL